MRPKAAVAWSSGKDSAFALHLARSAGEIDVVALLTTLTVPYGRVSMHGVREELLDRQAEAAGLPCHKVLIPQACTEHVYQHEMSRALAGLRGQGVTHVVFGDLFLAELRAYREQRMAEVGMQAAFPLWQRDTAALAREMIAAGLRATLTCVDPRALDRSWSGHAFDRELLDRLPAAVDPCGENGEFHTVAHAGPMFGRPIPIRIGETVERDGFVFTDVMLAGG
jgi:uncharacterized protein (TIGR00290 family)